MRQKNNESPNVKHLSVLISEAGADARKRRAASLKAHSQKLRHILVECKKDKKTGN